MITPGGIQLTDDSKPGYLARTPPDEKPGTVPSPASRTDAFSQEPDRPAMPLVDPLCAPRPSQAFGDVRVVLNDTFTEVVRLDVPVDTSGSPTLPYSWIDVTWWCDYPALLDLDFLDVRLKISEDQFVAIPLPTSRPFRIYRCFDIGTPIVLEAVVPQPFLLTGQLGTPVYVYASLQLGYADPQFNQDILTGKLDTPEGEKMQSVIVLPGSALANVLGPVPRLVATFARIMWPVFAPFGAVGLILVTTTADGGGPQVATVGLPPMTTGPPTPLEIRVNDAADIWVGDPLGSLVAPATITIYYDQWRSK